METVYACSQEMKKAKRGVKMIIHDNKVGVLNNYRTRSTRAPVVDLIS